MDIVWSVPSVILLVLAICNFLFSFVFAYGFKIYVKSLTHFGLKIEDCKATTGAESLLIYSVTCVMSTGLLCLAIYTLSLFYKAFNAIGLVFCPVRQSQFRKCLAGFESSTKDFSQYENEFDFEVDKISNN